jgi:DNA-binding LacI/PurR family transcriptional regulator
MASTELNPVRVLLVHDGTPPAARLLQGFLHHIREHRLGWLVQPAGGELATVTMATTSALVLADRRKVDEDLAQTCAGMPLVRISGPRRVRHSRQGRLDLDFAAAGRLAARTFQELGLRRVAAVGGWHIPVRRQVQEPFLVEAAALGLECLRCEPPGGVGGAGYRRLLATILGSPGGAIGTFFHQDRDAVWMLETCQELGLAVPEQVQVIGLDDNPLKSLVSEPSLSSIPYPWFELGRAAAMQVQRLLAGNCPGIEEQVAPLRVALRGSTATVAPADPRLARCDAFFARRPRATVAQAAKALGISVSYLERLHRAACGRSVHQRRVQQRLCAARDRIATGDEPLAVIARACGFGTYANLHARFVKGFGVAPSAYRNG